MAIPAHWQGLAEMAAEGLLNSVVEGVLLALFAWLLLRAMGKENSGVRFALLFCALAGVAGLPFLREFQSPTSAVGAVHTAFRLPGSLGLDFFVVWALIAAAGLAKIALGFRQLRKLRESCIALDCAPHPELRSTLERFGGDRRVSLCTSTQVRVPTAIGFMKPAIVIPSWAVEELTPDELNAVLLHELAHLRRWDDWTNLGQKIVRALLFFHPAVWWIGHGLAREREMACDDFVVSSTSDRRAYAQCLVSVAEKSFLRRGLALAQAMVGRMQLTAQRVARLLERGESNGPGVARAWKPALVLAAAFSLAGLSFLCRVPRLVAFDDEGTSVSAPVIADDSSGAAPRSLGAKMVPVALTNAIPDSVVRRKSATQPRKLQARQKINSVRAAASIRAESVQPQQVSLREPANEPNAVLVIMQTEQRDEYGRVWSVCVWRLTVFHPSDGTVDRMVRKGIVPKST